MKIFCLICHDCLEKDDEIYFTRCGHVFHFDCLTRWLKSSKTCPQCRQRTMNTNIYKVYFNWLENKIVPTNTSMQVSINKLKSQIFTKNKFIKFYTTKIASLEKEKTDLRQEAQRLELEINDAKSTVLNLQKRIDYLESLCLIKETLLEKYSEEHRGILKDLLEEKEIPPTMLKEGTKYFNAKTEDKLEKLIDINTQFNNEGIVDTKDIPLIHKKLKLKIFHPLRRQKCIQFITNVWNEMTCLLEKGKGNDGDSDTFSDICFDSDEYNFESDGYVSDNAIKMDVLKSKA